MKNTFKAFVLILLMTCFSTSVFSWGKTGHRIVGQIAMRHMSKKALNNTFAVLKNEDIAIAANWMDFIKSEPEMDFLRPWHYCTIPDSSGYDHAPEEGDAFQAMESLIQELKTKQFSISEEVALKSLIHIVGDVHQPLHVGNGTDRGGNDVKVEWFYKKSNLHRVWDSEMIDFEQLSYTEYATWIDVVSPDEIKQWQNDPILKWLEESKSLRSSIYNLPDNKKLSYKYHHDHIYELNKRLLQAGIRLAGILNEIYG